MTRDTDRLPPRIIAIANQKGGVGKTTTAINLGAALAERGQRILMVDLDPQGNASTGLGLFERDRTSSVYDVLCGDATVEEAAVASGLSRLSVLPAHGDLAGLDVELAESADRAYRLRHALRGEEGDGLDAWDVVLIDCPPSLSILTVNAMTAADSVLVPLQCEFFALEGLSQLLATIRRVQQRLNPGLKMEGIILTMYDKRNNLSAQVAMDVRENLGELVYRTLVPRNVRLSEAPSHSMPALVYDPDCVGSKAYRALADEMLHRSKTDLQMA